VDPLSGTSIFMKPIRITEMSLVTLIICGRRTWTS
jgi:hypothetical protein